MRVPAELPAERHDRTVAVVELEGIGVLAGLDQQPAKEGGADEAVGLGGDGVGEEIGEPLAEKGPHGIAERIPFHEGVKGRHRMKQGALHVGDPADLALVVIVRGAGVGRRGVVVEWGDARHRKSLTVDGGCPPTTSVL